MKNKLAIPAMFMAVLLLCCACTTLTGTEDVPVSGGNDVLRLYRNSSLVVMGACVRNHIDENGAQCSDLSVEEVVAGTAGVGDIVHCTGGTMKEEGTYLLYLAADGDVYHTEDMVGYTLLTAAPLPVVDGEVEFEGEKLSLGEIRNGIAEQDRVITAPSEIYYYADLESLAAAAEEIFIGRVTRVPKARPMKYRSDSGGSSIENTLDTSVLNVMAYGGIKGSFKYGDEINVVWCPAMSEGMTDAASLRPVSLSPEDVAAPKEGGVYIFFLMSNPDDKQTYYFGINPVQAMAELDEADQVHAGGINIALSGYSSLSALVEKIKGYVNS